MLFFNVWNSVMNDERICIFFLSWLSKFNCGWFPVSVTNRTLRKLPFDLHLHLHIWLYFFFLLYCRCLICVVPKGGEKKTTQRQQQWRERKKKKQLNDFALMVRWRRSCKKNADFDLLARKMNEQMEIYKRSKWT